MPSLDAFTTSARGAGIGGDLPPAAAQPLDSSDSDAGVVASVGNGSESKDEHDGMLIVQQRRKTLVILRRYGKPARLPPT